MEMGGKIRKRNRLILKKRIEGDGRGIRTGERDISIHFFLIFD